MFCSRSKRIIEFMQMAKLIEFLVSEKSNDAKILEIKAALKDGLIDDEQAFELALEYCY